MERKARLALERVHAKEKERRRGLIVKQAQSILAKAAPCMQVLEALLSKDGIDLVATPVISPVREALKQLVDWSNAESL